MPQALATVLVPWISNALLAVGLPTLAFGASVGAIALGASYLLLAGAAYLVSQAFAPPKPGAPKPEDGKYNLKQTVPPLVYVLGKTKKAGDYVFLEERNGIAYHIMVTAAHSIHAFLVHYLHDEPVTIVDGVITSPERLTNRVSLQERLGADLSSAYATVVDAFPDIWSNDHRGDGLASVFMYVGSVPTEELQTVYPHGMPSHSAVIEGHNRIYDPRTGTYGYTRNIALFRLWHLTHPVGGKLTLNDVYMPDWINAANVCDQGVTNRLGVVENRYHGGFWFRANNDPVEVGRIMDQAADMVLYERPDGKVGVHAGSLVEPDILLTANDIVAVSYDPNKRLNTSTLAVRGRYSDPEKGFNTTDAAIYGIPYPTDDERTKTVDNQCVQSHNHIARMQKLAYIRANAPRVTITAHYDPDKPIPYRRFIRVHYPPRLSMDIIEVTGRPVRSLRNLTVQFEGIVVPPTLYAFSASLEEGVPGYNVNPVERQEVPVPLNFEVMIDTEVISGGATAAFAIGTFDFQNENFQYELEWKPTAGGAAQQRLGASGELEVRSLYLTDGVSFDFRARTWSAGTPSEWTDYQTLVVVADPVAPGPVVAVSATGGDGVINYFWTAPNSPNYAGSRLYWNTSNTFVGATLAATEYGAPNAPDSRTISGLGVGLRYGFIVAINSSGVAASPVATGPAVTPTEFRGDNSLIKADTTGYTADEM
jgi:hypothetical protein